jgi:hypothetical protein
VPVRVSRAVYARVPWTKSYVLMKRESHGAYLLPGRSGYRGVRNLVIEFLRRTLRDETGTTRWAVR